ncbi:MAG: hypothetical protein J5860_00165 [Clostridia bacterium]|nr:hypothetical protein [Clostridia bacterium]MBO4429452.1 hypothetical protein [Clostridia bacterium]
MRYPDVPDNLQPMSPWKYFGLNILYAIPIIGFIFLVCHAIGSSNINKRNYARSFFCIVVVVAVIVGIFVATGAVTSIATAIAGGAAT